MTFLNKTANIKQFQLIKYLNKNCDDDHVVTKISIILRQDKIEAPFYIITKIKLSSCIDRPDNGIIHAMDFINHQRMHNLTEETYNEIKSLIPDSESEQVKITKKDKQIKLNLISRNNEEIKTLFKNYSELFKKIDNLID